MNETTLASKQATGSNFGTALGQGSSLEQGDEMGGAVLLVYGFMAIYGIAIGLGLGWLIWG